MAVVINSLLDVTIDGKSQGGVVDVLFHAANVGDEAIRVAMLDALIERERAAGEDFRAEIAGLTATNVKLQALIDSMGGTEVGQQLAREKRAAELQAAMDAADAVKQQAADELATLESGILK